jgi:hypothetical protein
VAKWASVLAKPMRLGNGIGAQKVDGTQVDMGEAST